MRITTYIFAIVIMAILAISFTNCGGHNSEAWEEMDRAEALVPTGYDSALKVLDAIDTTKLSDKELDHWKLINLYVYAANTSAFGLQNQEKYLQWGDSAFNNTFSKDEIKWHLIKAALANNDVDIISRLENLKDAEFLSIQLDSKFDLGVAYLQLASLYGGAMNGEVCRYYADKAVDIFRSLGYPKQLRESRMAIVHAYIADRNFAVALDSMEAMKDHVLANEPEYFQLPFLDGLAKLYDSMGRSKEAIAMLHELYDGKEISANNLAHWADAYRHINELDSAYMLITQARPLPKDYDTEYLCWNVEYMILEDMGRTSELPRIDSLRAEAEEKVHKARNFRGTSLALNKKYDNTARQAWYESRQAKTTTYFTIIVAVIILLFSMGVILYMRKRNQRLKLEHENGILRIASLQNNLFESAHLHQTSSAKIAELFHSRFKLLDGLAASYFECKETGQEQKRIYGEVKNSINKFSSDASIQELEEIVNGYNDKLMVRFREDFPKLSRAQYRLALYLFCGFSLPSISIFTDSDLKNIYVYKSRLKSVINKSESPNKEEYLSYFS